MSQQNALVSIQIAFTRFAHSRVARIKVAHTKVALTKIAHTRVALAKVAHISNNDMAIETVIRVKHVPKVVIRSPRARSMHMVVALGMVMIVAHTTHR
eukprot:2148916-Amphidinium_carterae.1